MCIHVVCVTFLTIYICKERVSAKGLCGLGALSNHYYYYVLFCPIKINVVFNLLCDCCYGGGVKECVTGE